MSNRSFCDDTLNFRQQGYVSLSCAISQPLVEQLRHYVDELENAESLPEQAEVYYESSARGGRRLVRQIENFCSFHQPLREFANDVLLEKAGEFLGEEAILFKDKINYKHSGGGGFPAHRDGVFWWRCPRSGQWLRGWEYYATRYISAAVFLDEANTDSGCLEFAPGSHTKPEIGEDYGELTMDQTKTMRFVPSIACAGDVLFMDARVPHRSGGNLSDQSRRVIYLTYNRLSEGDHRQAYFEDKRISLAAQGGAVANR